LQNFYGEEIENMFITFEGVEGSGKSTQAKLLYTWLLKKDIDCILTKEPGGTSIGEKIREILLSSKNKGMKPRTELFLYGADRVQHVEDVIKPAIKDKKIVICDRFADSTVAYQMYARGLWDWIVGSVQHLASGNLKPDITFLLDLPVEVGLKRAWDRINSEDGKKDESRIEEETLQFHEKVRNGYLAIAKKEPERFYVLDAQLPPGKIHTDIITKLVLSLICGVRRI